MKNALLVAIACGAALSAHATLYTYTWSSGFANGGGIPDGNPTGWSDTRTLSGIDNWSIADVNVRVEISGGYNGDLYGYLVHDSGFAVLLNRIGRSTTDAFGNSGAGMNVTLDDDNGDDIHLALSGVLSGTYRPDARTDDPAVVTESTANQTAWLSDFDNLDPNGTWTLFLADMSAMDGSTLVSWGLDIEAVPEPTTWALVGFASLFLGRASLRLLRARKATGSR